MWCGDYSLKNSYDRRIRRNYDIIDSLLYGEGCPMPSSFESPFLIRRMFYGCFVQERTPALSGAGSITSLSENIRYFLLKDSYLNIELINSHVAILYDFGKKRKLNLSNLFLFVENSEEVFKRTFVEKPNLKIEQINRDILRTFEESNEDVKDFPEFFSNSFQRELFGEIQMIRDVLYKDYLSEGRISSIESPTEHFYSLDSELFDAQVLYCQTKEAELLLELKNAFVSKVDKKAELPFIPFKSRAYVSYNKRKDLSLIIDTLADLNEHIAPSKFALKDLELSKYSSLTDEEFGKYRNIHKFLDTMNNPESFNKLLEAIEIEPYNFNEKLMDWEEAVPNSKKLKGSDAPARFSSTQVPRLLSPIT